MLVETIESIEDQKLTSTGAYSWRRLSANKATTPFSPKLQGILTIYLAAIRGSRSSNHGADIELCLVVDDSRKRVIHPFWKLSMVFFFLDWGI